MHQAKKLVLVLATSVSVTDSDEEVVVERIFCINYPV